MINLTANFGNVVEGLAAGDAYLSLDENLPYWDAVIEYAFNKTNNEFNTMAAAYAETGGIKHMFEWGTLGVNRQATNVRPRPTEERARLWKAYIIDRGPRAGVWVDFEYKPSIADVPVSTSIPQEIRAMMRKHQFRWKARVMENGESVTIERQDAQFLMIPWRAGMTGFRPHDRDRGYILTKSTIHATPGRAVQGQFNAFWQRYWNSRGPEKMAENLEKEITADFLPLFAVTTGKTIAGENIVAAVKARSKELQREVAAKAKARRRSNVE